jgi:hypothetical protein
MRHELTDVPRERFVRHPICASMKEAEHLRELANDGDSPATPVIVAAVVLAFVIPIVAFFVLLAFVISHFA